MGSILSFREMLEPCKDFLTSIDGVLFLETCESEFCGGIASLLLSGRVITRVCNSNSLQGIETSKVFPGMLILRFFLNFSLRS